MFSQSIEWGSFTLGKKLTTRLAPLRVPIRGAKPGVLWRTVHDAPQLPVNSLELNGLGAYIVRWISFLVCRHAAHRTHGIAPRLCRCYSTIRAKAIAHGGS